MLKLQKVSAQYDVIDGKVRSVNNLSLDINDNEILGIAGESGCGKSTLLKVMYGLHEYPLELSDGEVILKTTDAKGNPVEYPNTEIATQWWKKVSYVPQGAMHVMNPVVKIKSQFLDTISRKQKKVTKKELKCEISRFFKELDLSPEVLNAYPHQLSGGMRQRVLIALAAFLNPEIIFADEPTTALDVVVQRGILTLLKTVQRQAKNSMVIVSHDMGVHYQITNRLAIMYAGQLIEIGNTDEIFDEPKHPYTQMLINSLPKLGDNSQKEGISGTPPGLKNFVAAGCRFEPRCPKATRQCKEEEPATIMVQPGHMCKCHLAERGIGADE